MCGVVRLMWPAAGTCGVNVSAYVSWSTSVCGAPCHRIKVDSKEEIKEVVQSMWIILSHSNFLSEFGKCG